MFSLFRPERLAIVMAAGAMRVMVSAVLACGNDEGDLDFRGVPIAVRDIPVRGDFAGFGG